MPSLTQRLILWICLLFSVPVLQSVAQPARKPTTYLLNASLLQANKEKIRQGDHTLQNAQKALLAEADKVLAKPAHSVVEKKKTPPSGDKHDYMSVGPYWWPDSTKANGLPYIRKDGQINPERFAVEDETYLKNLCEYVQTLAVAYYFSDNEKYARKSAELLRVWFLNPDTKMNPNLNYGQGIPGITDGRGIGLIDTRSLANLTDAVQLLKDSKAWPKQDHVALQGWVKQFMDWMLTSPIGKDEEDEHNNHGTYYDFQIVAFALFLDNKVLAKQMLEQKTVKRIQSQLKADGSQPHELARTLSWNYSVMNLRGFFGLAQLAESANFDLWNYETPDGKSLKKAFLWLASYADGQKKWDYKQIKPRHLEEFVDLEAVARLQYGLDTGAGSAGHSASTDNYFALTNSLF